MHPARPVGLGAAEGYVASHETTPLDATAEQCHAGNCNQRDRQPEQQRLDSLYEGRYQVGAYPSEALASGWLHG